MKLLSMHRQATNGILAYGTIEVQGVSVKYFIKTDRTGEAFATPERHQNSEGK